MYEIFNKQSGLLRRLGVSNDTRDVEAAIKAGNERAIIAGKLFARRIADFVGQYFVRLGGADLIIFSAGIGENSAFFRKAILEDIQEALHLDIDYKANEEAMASKRSSPPPNPRSKSW
jgi:acetate kinase